MSFKLNGCSYEIENFFELGISAGYGTKELTLEELKSLAEKENKILISGVQTHSNNVVVLKKEDKIEKVSFEDTDGLITNNEKICLYTKHADCLSIYFYDKMNKVIGICHSGWRGSFNEICLNMIKKFKEEFNTKEENLIIAIGIGISCENYEVSEEFRKDFIEKFGIEIVNKSFKIINEKIYFDNTVFNYLLLIKNGINEENLYLSTQCTYDNKNLHSFRRDKELSGRNLAYIYI